MLGRLFLRTVPEGFADNSVYPWFLLVIPEVMDENLTELGQKGRYDFERPGSTHGTRELKEYGEVSGIIEDRKKFAGHPFLNGVSKVIYCPGFILATDTRETEEMEQRQMFKVLAEAPGQVDAITKSFYDSTKALIAKQS